MYRHVSLFRQLTAATKATQQRLVPEAFLSKHLQELFRSINNSEVKFKGFLYDFTESVLITDFAAARAIPVPGGHK